MQVALQGTGRLTLPWYLLLSCRRRSGRPSALTLQSTRLLNGWTLHPSSRMTHTTQPCAGACRCKTVGHIATSPTSFLTQDIRPVLLRDSHIRWYLSAFFGVKATATHVCRGLTITCTSLFSMRVACRSMQHIVIRMRNEKLHAAIEAGAADEEIAKLARIANQARENSARAGRSSNACLS
jgi:hypothetical protein